MADLSGVAVSVPSVLPRSMKTVAVCVLGAPLGPFRKHCSEMGWRPEGDGPGGGSNHIRSVDAFCVCVAVVRVRCWIL